jgi:hypothetical protein
MGINFLSCAQALLVANSKKKIKLLIFKAKLGFWPTKLGLKMGKRKEN